MVRPTDQGMTAIEKIVCYTRFQEGSVGTPHQASREDQGLSGGRSEGKENMNESFYCGFCRKEWEKQSM